MRLRVVLLSVALDLLSACSDSPSDTGATSAVTGSAARRLSRAEYDATLRDLLSDTSNSGFARLPEDVHDPFDNDYTTQEVSPALIEAADGLAQDAAARALADPAVRKAIVPCAPGGPGDSQCLRQFITTFGRRALRRPLSDDEVGGYLGLQSFALETGDFYTAVELVLRALLQHVEFLYRIENGSAVDGVDQVFRLNGFEVATRLSYFLLGTTPGDALLDLAAAGKLTTPEDVRAAAAMLLAGPRARERVERFHALWLGFHQLPHPADLTAELRAETAALINRVVFDQHGDYFDLFRAKDTFLTDKLAMHYGLPAPGSTTGAWVPYGASGRQGILSHGTVLSAGAKFADTSPTQRGLFIRTRLLCEVFGPPPPNVDKDNPPPGTAMECKIDRYRMHAAGGCQGCHGRLDPVGFGLENYDKAGRFRKSEDGRPECRIPGDGVLLGMGPFNGPAQLSDLLVASGALEACVVRQAYRFAIGRKDGDEDAVLVGKLGDDFRKRGHAFTGLLLDIVGDPSFGYRKQEP